MQNNDILKFSITNLVAGVLLLPLIPARAAEIQPTKVRSEAIQYTVQYQRWGDFGSYHLGMKITMLKNQTPSAHWYINGSWDTTLAHDTLLVYQLPVLFPVFLKAYIHPLKPTSPLFDVRKWEEFGPTSKVSSTAAIKLITMAHIGMTKINEGTFMYSPIVRPFKLGEIGFWTSNSYVSSLVHWINEDALNVPLPVGGKYPGINGPYISKVEFE